MFIAFLLASTSKPPTAGAPSTTAPPPQKQQQPQQQSQPQKTPAAASTTAPPPQKQQQQQAGTRQPQAASEGTASSAKAQRPDAAVEKEGGGGSSGFGGLNILSSFTKKDTSSGESGDTAGGKSKTAAQYELESTKLRREIQEREQRVCLGCCVFFSFFSSFICSCLSLILLQLEALSENLKHMYTVQENMEKQLEFYKGKARDVPLISNLSLLSHFLFSTLELNPCCLFWIFPSPFC